MRAALHPKLCCWKLKVAADSRRDQFAERTSIKWLLGYDITFCHGQETKKNCIYIYCSVPLFQMHHYHYQKKKFYSEKVESGG